MPDRTTARRAAMMAAVLTLIILSVAALACGPAAPAGQDSEAADTATPTTDAVQGSATATDTPAPTDTPVTVERTQTPTVASTQAVAPEATPASNRKSGSANADPCRIPIADVGRPVAPYVLGHQPAGSGGVGGASGAADATRIPDPTITVVEAWENWSVMAGEFHPPTVENMTLFHDVVAHGVAVGRTDLLYSADGRDFVYGFVNFRVTEYLKGSGDEYICVTDSPESDPYHRLYVGREYIVMLTDHDNLGGGLHSDAYDVSGAIGWQVDGNSARLMPEIPEPWRTVITSDRRTVDEFWLTPEPARSGLGETTDLAELKQRIKAAVVAESPDSAR